MPNFCCKYLTLVVISKNLVVGRVLEGAEVLVEFKANIKLNDQGDLGLDEVAKIGLDNDCDNKLKEKT